MLAVATLALSLAAGTVLLGQAVLARHRAEAAADLAALAAAAAHGGDGCRRATAVAARNGAVLRRCRDAPDLSVTVEVSVPLQGVLRAHAARARARAGPPQASSP
jgi:secretion/DNA translocation related TadE-like protein